ASGPADDGTDVAARAHRRRSRVRRNDPGWRGAGVDLQSPVRRHHRQRGRRRPRVERSEAAAARRARRGHQPADPSARRAVKLFSGLGERLRAGLQRSREMLGAELAAIFEPERPIDEALYAELEEVLIAADLGAAIAADFTNRAREEVMFGTVTRADELRPLFRR